MDLTEECNEPTTLILCFVCHDAELKKDYDIISKEVLPRLWLWCSSQKVKLFASHCRLKETLIEEVVNGLKCQYVNPAKPTNYLSFVVNLTSELLVETTQTDVDLENKLMLEFGCEATSAHSLFVVFRNICSSCFPGGYGYYESLFNQNGQGKKILHLAHPCQYCQESTEVNKEETDLSFCQKILGFLQHHIMTKLNSVNHFLSVNLNDQISQVTALQASLIALATADLHIRRSVLDKIETFTSDTAVRVPLLLLGETGSSKTSIMAAAVLQAIGRHLNSEPQHYDQLSVFYHFTGLLPQSAELDVFLRRLIKYLNLVDSFAVPVDICTAVQLCNSALSSPDGPRVTIFVDSVDLLDDIVSGQKLKWIPSNLAPRVHLILSATNGSPQHLALRERSSPPTELSVSGVPVSSKVDLVKSLFDDVFPSLSSDLGLVLAEMPASASTLWLYTACHLLRLSTTTAACFSSALDQVLLKAKILPKDFVELWEGILIFLERLPCCDLVVSALCLVASSAAGLRKSELNGLLNLLPLIPPSPFEEKAEAELLEKAMNNAQLLNAHLPSDHWEQVFQELKPCLVQLSDGVEDRFYLRHDTLKTAIRNRYFIYHEDDIVSDDRSSQLDISYFWHQRLASYFRSMPDCSRKYEEYLYQICNLEDVDCLAEYLTQWSVFDQMYTDEYSTILQAYWKKAGGADEMISRYKIALTKLEMEAADYNLLALRHERVARLFILAGKYAEALELAKLALKWEEKELGKRPERMVELYGLLTDIYDEKLKLQDFISPSQIPDLRKTISYGRKSIELRHQLPNRYHKFKLGLSLMKLAFSLESWAGCGGDEGLAASAALAEGQSHANKAIEIFQELNDRGHYAEALMTKGVLSPRGKPEQLRFYHEALEICQEVNGENHILTSRIYINIGIVYEDNKDYVKAYKYFAKWARVNEVVLGPTHPKTMRAKRVLKEPRYMYIASRLKDLERQVEDGDRENVLNEDTINQKAQNLDEAGQVRTEEANSEDEEAQDAEEPDVLDVMRPASSTIFNLASELRRTIEEMLQHAMRDSEGDTLQTLFGDNRIADGLQCFDMVSCSGSSQGDDEDDDDDVGNVEGMGNS